MKLYGFRICPFVERVKILLQEKQIVCKQQDVNIRDKPAWFLELTPEGKVPVLETQLLTGKTVLLAETHIICDYLDSLSPPSIYPDDVALKAYNQLWIYKAQALIFDAYHMRLAKSKAEFDEKRHAVDNKLTLLEQTLEEQLFLMAILFQLLI